MKAEPPGKEAVDLSKFFKENEGLWKDMCKQGLVKECDLKVCSIVSLLRPFNFDFPSLW